MQNEATLANTTRSTSTRSTTLLPYFICILAAMFYLYEFVLQVSPSVMTTELMRDLHLSAAGLGTMAAFYYYAYTPMQLPAGLLYDRFGPRALLTMAVLVCAAGALFFGLTNSVALASAGRFCMGFGSAFSFIGALLLVSRWFPPQYFAFLAGMVQLMSSIGAIAGEAPLAMIIDSNGWRPTIMWVAFIGVLLALLIWLVVKDSPAQQIKAATGAASGAKKTSEWQRLGQVCGSKQTWLIALYSFASWAPIVAFAALWGIPFLVTSYGISTKLASAACSMIWLGIGIGSPLAGWWSDHIGQRRLPLTLSGVIGLISSLAILYIVHLPLTFMFILLFCLGLASSGQSLSFGVVKDNNPPNVVGTAIGFNNMAVVAGGALFQPLVGILLTWHWHGAMQGGVPVYSVADYQLALLVVPLCYFVTVIVSKFFLRETCCQPTY